VGGLRAKDGLEALREALLFIGGLADGLGRNTALYCDYSANSLTVASEARVQEELK
jgi:hypothetical protein